MAALRAPRAHDAAPTASSSPRRSPRTTSAPATTCSRSPTTGSGPRRRRPTGCSCSRASELNCILPGARDGHVLGYGDRSGRRPGRARRRVRRPRAHGGVHRGARRRRLSRSSRTGRASRPARSSCPRTSRGSRSGTPAASSRSGAGSRRVHWDELLETGRRCFGLATDDSHHPGFDSDRGWTWLRVQERTRDGGARRARLRLVLRQLRAAPARCRGRRRRGGGPLQPGALRHARLGPQHGRRRERGPARLPVRGQGARDATTTAGSRRRG